MLFEPAEIKEQKAKIRKAPTKLKVPVEFDKLWSIKS